MSEFYNNLKKAMTTMKDLVANRQQDPYGCSQFSESVLVLRNQLLALQSQALQLNDHDEKLKKKFSLALIYRLLSDLSFLQEDESSGLNCILLAFHHLLDVTGVEPCQVLKIEAGIKLARIELEMKKVVEGHETAKNVTILAETDDVDPGLEKRMVSNKYFMLYRKLIGHQTGLSFENEAETNWKLHNAYLRLMERVQLSPLPIPEKSDYGLNVLKKEMAARRYNPVEWISHACEVSFRYSLANNFKQSLYLIQAATSVLSVEKERIQSLSLGHDHVAAADQMRFSSGRIAITKAYHCFNLLTFAIKCKALKKTFREDFDKLRKISSELRFNTKPMIEFNLVKSVEDIEPIYEKPSLIYEDIRKIYSDGMKSLETAKNLMRCNELVLLNYQTLHDNLNNLQGYIK